MAEVMKRSMSSREMMVKVGKEVAKSVVVAKGFEYSLKRTGAAALASTAGMAVWGGSLMLARKVCPSYLDPVSSNQIIRDPEYTMNCHLVIPTKDIATVEAVYHTFQFYCDHYTRFRERVVVRDMLWPYWEEMPNGKVELDQHIFVDNNPVTKESVQEIVSRSLSQGMNPLLPLWKVTLFTHYAFEDGTVGNCMFVKWHHCMGDGFSMVRTFTTGAEVLSRPPPKPASSSSSSSGGGGVFGKTVTASAKLVLMKDDPASQLKASKLLKPLDERHACWVTSRASINDIKRGAKAHGFTLNDVVLGALSASLRNYQMQSGKGAVVDPLAGVWVALRPLSEAFEEQDMNKVKQPSNETLGCVYVRLPVVQEFAKPVDRVQAVYDQIIALKGSPEPILAQAFMKLFGLMPTTLTNPIWDAVSNKISISVSNVPGPPLDFTWCGTKPESLNVFVPPVGTISTFALITSLNDRITLSLALDGTVFSKDDAAFITNDFDKELCLLTTSMQPSRL